MQQSVVEMAKDLVKVQIEAGQLTPGAVQQALRDTFSSLITVQAGEDSLAAGEVAVTGRASASGDWRKSISRHAITCLECGSAFKQLSIRHLRTHDLNARLYRTKYDIPRTQSLAARATTARRRQVVQETRPWEKTPRYLEAQARKAAVTKKRPVDKRSRKTKNR